MLTITIKEYDESNDIFKCDCADSISISSSYEIDIPATLMPYIAYEATSECDDLPYDMIGKTFKMTSPLID